MAVEREKQTEITSEDYDLISQLQAARANFLVSFLKFLRETRREVNPTANEILTALLKGIELPQGWTGILGREARGNTLGCVLWNHKGPTARSPKPGPPIERLPTGRAVLRYFVESLPEVAGESIQMRNLLLMQAWESWCKFCSIEVTQEVDPKDANVVVNCKGPKESGTVLAIAGLGPPNGHQLELTFDNVEPYTRHTFLATATHQIGHILGVRHNSQPNQLMNDTLNDAIEFPQEFDVIEAVGIWGAR